MKSKKMKKILPVILLVLLVAAAIPTILWGLNHNKPGKTEGVLKEMPKAEASDEETLRKLLLEESERTISVDKDLEVDTQFIVKGKKTLTGNGELRMALRAEWGQSLLVISEGTSLTMDGLVLNGNYVADGIHMEKTGELTYLSGTMKCTDSYGIWAQGKVTIKDIKIDRADYIAVFAQKGSKVDIKGGTLTKTATNDVYVQKGATVNITGTPTMEDCTGDALVNYGTLNVHGGIYTGANSYTFNNYGDLKVVSEGKGSTIKCSGSRLGVFCTRKGAKTTLTGVHVYDTKRQGVVTVGGKTEISDCTFERTGYHSIEIQTGKANIENVTIKESKNGGIESYTDAVVTIKGLQVDGCDGIGVASRGAKITGSDIKVTGAKKYGISCGNSKNGKASVTIIDAVIADTEKSGFYVYNEANMKLENIQVSKSKSRGIYIADNASLTLSGNSIVRNNEYRGIEARGKFVMNDGKVYDNKVKNSGAGVYVSEKGDFTMNGGSIYNNTSDVRGGGICVTDGTVTINKGDIYNNTSTNNGGGLYAQKKAVVTLKSGSIRNNRSEAYGDGIHIASAATKVTLGDQFYVGKNDIKVDNVENSLQITGSRLAKHSASDPLLLTPNYNAKEGTVVASCKNASVAKALAVKVGSGDGSYNIVQNQKDFGIAYAKADMDMTGADTVYVSNFKELKSAVMGTKAKRYIVLKADIVMEERLRFPGGVTICIKDDGAKRTITRAAGFSDNLLVTHYGTGLYLEATKPGNLVLDGGYFGNVDAKKVTSLVRTAGSTVFRNVTLQNNGVLDKASTVRGAFLRQLYGDFKIYNTTMTGGSCESGGAVMIDKGAGYIEESTFSGNQSVIGAGAIRAAANTKLEIKTSVFTGNHAGTTGGAVVAVGGANVNVTDTKFVNNTAANFGGALSAQDVGTVLTLKGTDANAAIFADNSAKTIGAVCVQMQAQLNISGYRFENNTASGGRAGALAVNNGAAARIENTTFYKNQASGSGGAVSVDKSSLEAVSCDFGKEGAGNMAGDKGGAILVTGNGSLIMDVMKDGLYNGLGYNQAVVGGAVCVYGGKADISHYTIKGNQARDGGGAVYIDKGSSAACSNVEFVSNIATKETEKGIAYSNGGAVQVLGTFIDIDSTYTGNTGRNGGALIVMTDGKAVLNGSGQNALFKDNVANGNGGAIFVNIGGLLETEGYQFEANHANAGGALYAQKDAKSVIVTGSVMKFNEARQGGAVFANGKGLVITDSKFEENHAVHATATASVDGGAIYANTDSDVIVKKCEFTKNTGKTSAGAIFIIQNAAVTNENSTFTENSSPGNGGAVHCKGTYNDTNSSYTGNTGRNGGAIIAINGGIVTLAGTDAKFNGNQATANGSAIFVQSDGSALSVTGYTFEGDVTQTVQVNGNLTFDNITGATLVKGARGTLSVAGYQEGNQVTITPNAYTEDAVVLMKSETVTDEVFKAACAGVTITPDSNGKQWFLGENGQLQKPKGPEIYVARIGSETYESFTEAIDTANAADSDVVIYLSQNVDISKQVTINKNITITNEPDVDITITRSANVTMFYVNSSAKLTLGTTDDNEAGTLIVDGATTVTQTTRIVDNRANATFILGKNATLQNANNNQWGSALINRGNVELYGNVKDNTCTGAGGAILQYGGKLTVYSGSYTGNKSTRQASGSATAGYGGAIRAEAGTVEIKDGTFSGNSSVGQGGVLWAKAGTTVIISGGTFQGNTAGEGGNIYSNVAVEIAGLISDANGITFTPGVYEEGKAVLIKGDTITNEEFRVACAGVTVTPDADGNAWMLDESGKLQKSYAVRIGNKTYAALVDAIADANNNGSMGAAEDVVVYVNGNVVISNQVTINKNITITNEPGKYITLTRSANKTMFYISSGAKLTLGTNNDSEKGQLIIDGGGNAASSTRIVDNRDNATFILGKNATMQNANNNQWGSALINRKGTVELYGTVRDNTCTGDGGAILQHGAGKLTVYEGTYAGNKSTNKDKNAWGSVIRAVAGTVEIKGGTFTDNSTVKLGGVLYVAAGAKVAISGGTFKDNTAGEGGNAVYIAAGGTITVTGGEFETEAPAQEIYVAGKLEYSKLPEVLIKKAENGSVVETKDQQ